MTTINLHSRRFSPIENSEAGRVSGGTIFEFQQEGIDFSAVYSGAGVSDGHLVGKFVSAEKAELFYHSRAKDGTLEAGQASAAFDIKAGKIVIQMTWQWLTGTQAKGQSYYEEIL